MYTYTIQGEDIDLFSTLRRVRSCKDATNYKDVVCERLRKRLRFTPADDTTDDLSSGDDVDNEVTVQSSYTSISSEEGINTLAITSSSESVSGESNSERNTFCRLSESVLNGDKSAGETLVGQHKITDNTSFQNILTSPIVEAHKDDRMQVRTSSGTPAQSIVRAYDCTGSPNTADMKAHDICGTYNSIVPPLSPNTGQTICKFNNIK